MEAHQVLGEALCRLQYAGRNPSFEEYQAESPAGQRAILSRWQEIRLAPTKTLIDLLEWSRAVGRLGRVHDMNIMPKSPWWHEDYLQGDYDMVDSRQEYEHGE